MAVNERKCGSGPDSAERDPRLDRLYRETPREAPPAHLDAAILAAARREVGAGPRPLMARLRRWRVPVSIAAVIVLSASLVTLVREEGGEPPMHTPPATAPAAQPADPRLQPAPVESAPQRPPASTAAPSRPARRDERAASAPVELGKMADSARPDAGQDATQGMRAAAAPEAAGARALPQPFQGPQRAAEGRAAAPQPAVGEERAERTPAVAAPRREPVATAPEALQAKPVARSMQAEKAPARERLPVWHGLDQEPAQKWFDRIAELKRQGRTAEAGQLLTEFKRRFPDHRLPPGLE